MRRCSTTSATTCCSRCAPQQNRVGIAWLSLAAGRFASSRSRSRTTLAAELERLRPAEILIAESASFDLATDAAYAVRRLPEWHFEVEARDARVAQPVRYATISPASARTGMTARNRRRGRAARLRARNAGQCDCRMSRALAVEHASANICRLDRRHAPQSRNLPKRCAASPRRRCCRCSTRAPPAWAAGCCATALHHPLRDHRPIGDVSTPSRCWRSTARPSAPRCATS